jgi:MerR family Zn(II)-responsive transcriptional regulator of zntA
MILINQLAKQTGTPIHTIRYYENFGLFKGKKNAAVKTNNYSWYDDEVIEKLELIKEAKTVGFTLVEIKGLIDAWYSKSLSTEKKKEILERKMMDIDKKIEHLKQMKSLIAECIVDVADND